MSNSTLKSALLLGTAAGMRTLAPWGGLVLGGFYHESLSNFSGKKLKKGLLAVFGMELMIDKLPVAGARISPIQLVPRMISGGWSSACLASRKQDSVSGFAILGGITAIISAFIFYETRKRIGKATKLPDSIIALGEDVLATRLAILAVR